MPPATNRGSDKCPRVWPKEKDKPLPQAQKKELPLPARGDDRQCRRAFRLQRFAEACLFLFRPPGNRCASKSRRSSNGSSRPNNAHARWHWPALPARQTAISRAWWHWPSLPTPASPDLSGKSSIEIVFGRGRTFSLHLEYTAGRGLVQIGVLDRQGSRAKLRVG